MDEIADDMGTSRSDSDTLSRAQVADALDTSNLDPDSITAATTRNSYDEITTYLP